MCSSTLQFSPIVRNKEETKWKHLGYHSSFSPTELVIFICLGRLEEREEMQSGTDRECISQPLPRPSLLAACCACAFYMPTPLWYLPRSLVSHRCPPARGRTLLGRHLSGEPPTPSLEWQTHTELPAKPSPFFQPSKCLWLHLEPGRTNSISESLLIYPRTQHIVSCDSWWYFLFSLKYKWTIFHYSNLWRR